MRNKRIHIYSICLVLTALLFSCSKNTTDDLLPSTRAEISVGLTNDGDLDRQEVIKSIRFIVFTDMSGAVKLDVNRRIILSTPGTATDITAQLLEVASSNDIMVVVIANEPQNLTDKLDGITHPWLLQNIDYDIATILNSDGEIVSTTGMPMTGVIRDISVKPEETKTVEMSIERAVARVDFFLEATDDGAETGYTAGSTSVTLHNSTHNSYFVMGNKDNGTRDNVLSSKNYGKVMKNVSESDLIDKTWTATTTATWSYTSATGAKNRRLLSSFYTAERIFKADYSDRLSVSMTHVRKGPSGTTGITGKVIKTITKVDSESTPVTQPFTEIRRNNVYQITARVGKLGIQILKITVESWGEKQDIDLNMDL